MKKKRTHELSSRDAHSYLLSATNDFFVQEAYKTLRTNTTFALAGENLSKVVIVTSSLQSEGKSTTAANLAFSYAQSGKNVLLVDCDLRRPNVARLLSLSAPLGLSNLLISEGTIDQAIVHSEAHGIDVILSGDIPPNPAELLGSSRMHKLIETLRDHYDYIVLDTPPVNMVTDAVVLSPLSDGILFVVFSNNSERGPVVHAVEQLQYANAKIIGFVLNGVTSANNTYGKYSYKKYGYGYGYSSKASPDKQDKND